MNDRVTDKATHVFGELQVFKKTKIINMNTALLKNDGSLWQMNQEYYNTKSDEDKFAESFIRCYSDCILTTFNNLRRQEALYQFETNGSS